MSSSRRFAVVVVQMSLLVAIVALVANFQWIADQYALATYRPSQKIAEIESNIAPTDYARALLYRSDPRVDSKAQFNTDCQTKPGDLELGCYYRGRIYILSIENTSLASEMDVVTAHEMLHVGWERLSTAERARLTTELEAVYAGISDPDLKDRMASYAKSEPGEQANELHAILASEEPVLTPELEKYYARYFVDRQKIVAAHAKYSAVFDTRRRQLESELTTIRSLKSQLNALNSQMDNYKSAGRIAQYNALVSKQNSLVDNINDRIDAYQKGVDEYNALSLILDSQQITDVEASVK